MKNEEFIDGIAEKKLETSHIKGFSPKYRILVSEEQPHWRQLPPATNARNTTSYPPTLEPSFLLPPPSPPAFCLLPPASCFLKAPQERFAPPIDS